MPAYPSVPFLDLQAAHSELRPEIEVAVKRVLGSGCFVLGPEVEQFERRFADYCGVQECVGVGNGLDALTLVLAAYDVGPGDEVIVPGATFIATWLAVSRIGATPVPVDVDHKNATYTLEPAQLEAAINERTRAIVPVHLYGQPADLGAISEIAHRHGLVVIDDAAQAHGARYGGRPIGGLTSASAFSFYPSKNLGALGDAGAVTTNDPDVADRVRMLRNYGMKEKYRSELAGWNSRLDPLQAAVLDVKLDRLDEWNARRGCVAARYREALSTVEWMTAPGEASRTSHVYHLFVVRVPRRDLLVRHLSQLGIESGLHYPVPPTASRSTTPRSGARSAFPNSSRYTTRC